MMQARHQAQENANWVGIPYRVFFDTSGNARCEGIIGPISLYDPGDVYYPIAKEYFKNHPSEPFDENKFNCR
jgi:hypothetical protein